MVSINYASLLLICLSKDNVCITSYELQNIMRPNLNPPVIKAAGEAAFVLCFVLVFITMLRFCFHIYFASNAGICLDVQACFHFIRT